MSDKPQAPLADTGALKIGTLRPGSEVLQGRFKVLQLLGSGGMGDVYLAEQVSLGRKVALKTLREDLSLQPGMTERFKREARLLSTVDHPSIVRVIDFGQAEGAYVLVMEFVEGDNLATEVRRGAFEPARAISVMKDIADGLAAIHAQGIIHRDLKPDNVLLTLGPEGERARLLDFGIARLAEEEGAAAMTQAGLVLGTPEYLSPEQATGGQIDARSDVYAFGVLAFRLLAGRHPFPGPSARDFLLQHITQQAPELSSVAPQLVDRPALTALVMSCLSKEPAQRPDGGKGLLTALAKLEVRPSAPVVTNTTTPLAEPPPPTLSPTVPSKQLSSTSASASLSRAKNLAVVMIDIKGFEALAARLTHDENALLLADYNRLVLGPLKSLGGQLVYRWQDRAVATFESPTAAVQFGMAAQDGLWRHNSTLAADRRLGIGVAVHLGEVVVSGEAILGEPAQVVTEAGRTSSAGEVVFTQAVWLSMNRVGFSAEPRGALTLQGQPELPLYRCVPSAEGAPFGGADLKLNAASDSAALVGRGKTFAVSLAERFGRLERRVRIGVIVGVVVLVLGAWLMGSRDPLRAQAGALLDQGLPTDALELLDTAKSRSDPAYRLLRAEALHQLKRHRDEWDLVKGAHEGLDELRKPALIGLMEDFVKSDREEALRAALSKLPRSQLSRVKDLAGGPASNAQWGAAHYLDVTRASGADLVSYFIISLESPDCQICAEAATRLGELGDKKAIEPLERLKKSPRKKVLFFVAGCGHDEAANALEKLNPQPEP